MIIKAVVDFKTFINTKTCICESTEFVQYVMSVNKITKEEAMNLFELLDEFDKGNTIISSQAIWSFASFY